MANKQTTAVEWLTEQIKEIDRNGFNLQMTKVDELAKQALAMEREQIETAYKSDRRPCSDEDAQEYYNDTYGTDKN